MFPCDHHTQVNDEDDVPPPIPPRPPKPKASEYEFLDAGEELLDTGEGEVDEPDYQNVKGDGAEDSTEILSGKEKPAAADQ